MARDWNTRKVLREILVVATFTSIQDLISPPNPLVLYGIVEEMGIRVHILEALLFCQQRPAPG